MTALDLVRAARRHLVVVLVCIAVTCVGTAGVYLKVPVHHLASSELVVLSPDQQVVNGQSTQVNPFLYAGDQAAQVTASALASVASSDSFGNELKARGLATGSKPTVGVALTGGGVVLNATVDNVDSSTARRDLGILSTLLGDSLRDRQTQAGAPANQLFVLRDLVGASAPATLSSDRSKLTGVAFGLGLLLTVVVVVVVEGRRRSRLTAATRAAERDLPEPGAEMEDALTPRTRTRPDVATPPRNGEDIGRRLVHAANGDLSDAGFRVEAGVLDTIRNHHQVRMDTTGGTAAGLRHGSAWLERPASQPES